MRTFLASRRGFVTRSSATLCFDRDKAGGRAWQARGRRRFSSRRWPPAADRATDRQCPAYGEQARDRQAWIAATRDIRNGDALRRRSGHAVFRIIADAEAPEAHWGTGHSGRRSGRRRASPLPTRPADLMAASRDGGAWCHPELKAQPSRSCSIARSARPFSRAPRTASTRRARSARGPAQARPAVPLRAADAGSPGALVAVRDPGARAPYG